MYKPTLIIHGGAGTPRRSHLPPPLYAKYRTSLLTYLRSTKHLLDTGSSALDAAVHAIAQLEDDPLFNCGRGSVFTRDGTIEMEASIMVTSVHSSDTPTSRNDIVPGSGNDSDKLPGSAKRGVGVMGLRNVRHPIYLARECLLRGPDEGGSMHAQLCAPYVEKKAYEWGLERKPDRWFWTRRRWREHRRGLRKGYGHGDGYGDGDGYGVLVDVDLDIDVDIDVPDEMLGDCFDLPSQGTVGCVCLDAYGNLAVATSTGGRTNKWPGRIGDTPTLGSGFWAEAWEDIGAHQDLDLRVGEGGGFLGMALRDCMGSLVPKVQAPVQAPMQAPRRRAVAVSGTGDGDAFLRVGAARTACAMLRFSPAVASLAEAVTAVVGPGGELSRSGGSGQRARGENRGGLIGIEVEGEADEEADEKTKTLRRGKIVFDFCSEGMWRAWMEEGADGQEVERVMVFREEYEGT